MFCAKCGNKIDEGAKFCRVCGAAASSVTDAPKDAMMGNTAGVPDVSAAGKSTGAPDASAAGNVTGASDVFVSGQLNESVELLDEAREAQVLEEIELSLLLAEVDEEIAMRKSGDFSGGFNAADGSAETMNATYDRDGGPGNVDEDVDDLDDSDDDIDIESRPGKRKYQQTGSERRAAYKTKTRAIKAKTKKKSVQMIIAAVVIFIAALGVVGFIVVNMFKGSSEEQFIRAIEAYEAAMAENDSDFGAYQHLLKEAKQALEDGDADAYRDLMNQMEEAIEQMTGEMDSHMELSELKTYYSDIFAKYQITDSYKEAYDDLMARLDKAIEERDEDAARDLKKELHSMRINLGNENQNLIQAKINEINKMNIPKANASESAKLEEFEEKLDAALAEENFIEALSILDDWYATAEQIEARIKKEAEEEKAKYEKESRAQAAKESEEAAKRESEEEAKRESEEAAKRESEEAAKRESEEAAKRESQAAANQNSSTSNPPASSTSSKYIIADSNTRYLTEADVSGLSAWEKRLARNEIYARHGRRFNNADIQAYFDSQSWYNGTIAPSDFSESILSDIEKKNVALIGSLE